MLPTLPAPLSLWPVRGLGEIVEGDDLPSLIIGALQAGGLRLESGDVLVVTQKIVSKAEGRVVELRSVQPSERAVEWATRWGKDARVVELVLRESRRIVRMERGIIIAETAQGHICANAGIDGSNVGPDQVVLLPVDPDGSADGLRSVLELASGVRLGVIVSDTFGRPWRSGQTNVAIGVSGLRAVRSFEGQVDPSGYALRVTALAVADEIAGAAELVMGKLDRVPVALVRGLPHLLGEGSAGELVRAAAEDMFR